MLVQGCYQVVWGWKPSPQLFCCHEKKQTEQGQGWTPNKWGWWLAGTASLLETVMRWLLLVKAGATWHRSALALGRQPLQWEQTSPDPGTQQSREGNQSLDAYRGREKRKEGGFTFASLPLVAWLLCSLLLSTHTSSCTPGNCPQWEASAISSCAPCLALWHDFHLSDHSRTELLLQWSHWRLQVTQRCVSLRASRWTPLSDAISAGSRSVLVSEAQSLLKATTDILVNRCVGPTKSHVLMRAF